jgi:hypothetical protein
MPPRAQAETEARPKPIGGVHHHTGCYCPDGVTADIWRLALENFPAPRGKMVGPQGVCVP